MSEAKKNPSPASGSDPQIDRVRELILGPFVRESGQRIQDLGRDIQRMQQEIDRLAQQVADQEQEQSKRIQALRQESRDDDSALRTELREATQQLTTDKMDRSALGELFIELGNQIKAGGSLGSVLSDLLGGE
jgi:SMC interacting uncharacterized protein involved in chromosome segregation